MPLTMFRWSAGLLLICAGSAVAQDPSALYRESILPILQTNCLPCHNQTVKQNGLDLSTRESLLKGSEHGPVVVLGKPEDSRLYKLVTHVIEPGMPFKGKKLPDDAIAKLAEWIKAGVPYGEASPDGVNLAEARKHWAFRQPVKPALPAVRNRGWVRNPVDAFVAAEHEKRGISPLPEADQRTLLRRVCLDLTGLPPSPAEMAAFLADKSAQAYEKVVDKLLASPGYGERWGGTGWTSGDTRIGTDGASRTRCATRSGTSGGGGTGRLSPSIRTSRTRG